MSRTSSHAAVEELKKAASSSSSSSSSSKSSAVGGKGGLRVHVRTDETYGWQSPNKLLYALLCFNGCYGKLAYVTIMVLCAVCTGSIVFGFNLSLLNTSIATIGRYFQWCGNAYDTGCDEFKLKSAFIQTGIFIGAAIGAMTAGSFIKGIGCRTVFFVSDIVITVGVVFSCVSGGFPSLLVARLVVGVGVGIIAVTVPTYIAEITPPSNRGAYGVLHQLLITFGILIAVLIGIPFSDPPEFNPENFNLTDFDKVWWRVMLGMGMIPIVAMFFMYSFVFTMETPFYLMGKERYSEAHALLQKLTGKSDVTSDFNDIYHSVRGSGDGGETMSLGGIMKHKQGRYALFIGTSISALQQFTGINVFITSSNKLFSDAGLDQDLVTIMSIVLTTVNFLMTFPSIYLIEKLGRKMLLLIGTAGMGLSVLPGGVWLLIDDTNTAASWVAVAGAIVFIIFFSCTWGPVVWVYLFEIFPADMKDSAAGFMTAWNWLAGIVMVFAASWIPTEIGYIVFFCFNIIGFFFVLFLMKETRGMTVGQSPYF